MARSQIACIDAALLVVACPACGGDGGGESSVTGYNHINGEPTTHWITCDWCGGSGEFHTHCSRRTLEDIEDEAAEEAATR
jgi:hypothetical protein